MWYKWSLCQILCHASKLIRYMEITRFYDNNQGTSGPLSTWPYFLSYQKLPYTQFHISQKKDLYKVILK